ncbi:hypothetical protein DTO013E5_7298 [Penicillium roqueforti]|uniref:Genomic scaffold, ProqFM164S03 n=1 Tax=Penicillium roqueforti (strain FM164) TaxID=1365484 RepID=W6QGW3_PENRF|nr:uncharacterized protein LCP9604111_3058 [Penicillium roqueforti]CDM33429.1 unnamed protein product [Penicillium roqueforti FM164]KAF9250854.1 hypothetical protein LCP9604111_3058 [Penicillium roqueforti]KAI1830920.1 hypothetical protein CBS147337_8277 [Penicillium roqueforti]KAI2681475.1 hypothetical protein CBS147355_2685 [Penicillium roqueforti]KAI2688863.1 hypothetical protein LCP963914a_1952 [Penicillium roqueforti]
MVVTAGNLHDDKGPKILAVLWTLTGLTAVMVVARVYIRLKLLRNFGLDDYLIVVSMIMGFAYCGISTAGVGVGYGKHSKYLSTDNLEKAILLNTVSFLFGIFSFTLPKIAVTSMLTRILNPKPLHKAMLWTMVGTTSVVSITCIIILFTMCDPAEALWKPELVAAGAKCKSTALLIDFAIFTGSISALADLTLAVYPTTVLLKLQMSLRKRIALCAALGLGGIASAMAIIKCTQLHGLADKSDYTYGTADLVMWTNIEADVVVLASCIPTLQPLLEILLGKRAMGSYSQGKSDQLKTSSNFPSSFHRSKQSKPHDDLCFTNIDDQESQESILHNDDHGKNSLPLGRIHRKDDVVVEYESSPPKQGQGSAYSHW